MKLAALLISFLSLLASSLNGQADSQAGSWLAYEPAVVNLEGKLVVLAKYGPPNFGKSPRTDQKLKVPVLVLSHRVNVKGTPGSELNSESIQGVRQIQLVFLTNEIPYRYLVRKEVAVRGTLFRAHTGHHYTDVLLTVQQITEKARKAEK
jgi:hypothetical protein